MTGHGYNFYCPILSMNKIRDCIENGKQFLEEIARLLLEFGIKSNKIIERLEYVNKKGMTSYKLRLVLSGKPKGIINLYSRVGFEYNSKRKFLANVACQYLRLKEAIINEREEVAKLAPALAMRSEWHREGIYEFLESPYVSRRFIERSLYEARTTSPRLWGDDLKFDEFKKIATEGLGTSGIVWDNIKEIVEIDHDDYVYDFTVEHPHHNFIANSFVVSNCGVRLAKTTLFEKDIKPKIKDLVYGLYNNIPAGVGSRGDIKVDEREERIILTKGASWALSRGYATESDIEHTEEGGAMDGANPDFVSERAYERGGRQSGTLGSGNHFIEVQAIDNIYDENAAKIFGLQAGQVTVMIHSGSRGLGYQICDDYAKGMVHTLSKFNIQIPDRQLACAPLNSEEGKRYFGAMACAANYAWNNRQCLMHLVRLTFEKVFGESWQKLGIFLIYDVAHNIAKLERHKVNGKEKLLCVHRKGATRAFGPGRPDIPAIYKEIGQPIIIPGDMGRNSYLLVGTQRAMDETFGSTCHGAGRCLSRTAAMKSYTVNQIRKELEEKGIALMASGKGTIVEEAPGAYKDVNDVVEAVEGAGISRRVCRMRPLGVLKG
jgi:tRNA-splicing ligase RtcB